MKVIISESQYELLAENKFKESLEEYMDLYDGDVNSASESSGIELYKFIETGLVTKYYGKLNLQNKPIKDLGELEFVGGYLHLSNSEIKSLGKLEWVGKSLGLSNTKISDLGNLVYVGGELYLRDCPLAKLSDEEINKQVFVGGKIIR
jgi:hypothetical protein